MAHQMEQANPELVEQLRRAFGGGGNPDQPGNDESNPPPS